MSAGRKGQCRAVGALMIAISVAGCGGGGEGPGECFSPTAGVCNALGVPRSFPQATPSAVGLYKGITSNGRAVASLVLSNNAFYAIYSGINAPSVAAGAVQGTIRAEGGQFMVTDAVDVNLEGLGTQTAAVSGTYGQKQFINGTVSYPAFGQNVSFTANYSADFDLSPSLAAIAGSYVGTSAGSTGRETITMEVSTAGALSGQGTSGCTFSGTLKPRTDGNAYDMTVTFGGAPCRFPGATVSGASYFDRSSNLAYSVGFVPQQNMNFIVIGTKQ